MPNEKNFTGKPWFRLGVDEVGIAESAAGQSVEGIIERYYETRPPDVAVYWEQAAFDSIVVKRLQERFAKHLTDRLIRVRGDERVPLLHGCFDHAMEMHYRFFCGSRKERVRWLAIGLAISVSSVHRFGLMADGCEWRPFEQGNLIEKSTIEINDRDYNKNSGICSKRVIQFVCKPWFDSL